MARLEADIYTLSTTTIVESVVGLYLVDPTTQGYIALHVYAGGNGLKKPVLAWLKIPQKALQ